MKAKGKNSSMPSFSVAKLLVPMTSIQSSQEGKVKIINIQGHRNMLNAEDSAP